jgi:23S rRNA (adenine2030-N6)-methyltransferase
VLIERGDGFAALKTLLPPPSRRALVLIDPPYEDKNDYRKVKDALEEALGRFPTGTYAVWYPLLVSTPGPAGFGLHSSGMFIMNPPYTLEPLLRQVMPYLVKVLGKDAGATFVIEKGEQMTGSAAQRTIANGAIRTPVGNARRASPLAGGGSLRLPGQAPVGSPGAEPKDESLGRPSVKSPAVKANARKFMKPASAGTAGAAARPAGKPASGRPVAKSARPRRP